MDYWSSLSNIGITSNLSINDSRKIVLTNQIAFISFIIIVIMNSSFIFINAIEFQPMSIITAPIILTAPLLNHLKKYKISSFSIATLMPLAALFFSSLSKTLMAPPIPLVVYIFPKLLLLSFIALPLILIDIKNRILFVSALIINLLCILMVESLNELMGVGMNINNITIENFERINFLILFPLAILLFGFTFLIKINAKYEHELLTQKENLETAYAKIEDVNSDITDSIEYAKYIQSSILPNKNLLTDFFKDSFVFYKAKSIVSGDFYYFKRIAINNEPCMIISAVDCTGHGVPGGFMSMLGISLLNEIVSKNNFKNAADILNKLREQIKLTLNQTGSITEQKDGMEMSLVIYYSRQKKMEFSGARNPIYIVSNNKELNIYKGDSMPIGIHLMEEPFNNIDIKLSGGDMCYLFTDGIIDQMNDKGAKFMSKRLKVLLTEISTEICNKQQVLLGKKMQMWMNSKGKEATDQIDDMLLIGFRINE